MDEERLRQQEPSDEYEMEPEIESDQSTAQVPVPLPLPLPVPVQAPSFIDNFKKTSSNIFKSPMLETTKEKVQEVAKNYGATIIIGIVIAIVLFILAYLLYVYISAKITNKLIVEVPTSSIPRKGNVISKMDGKVLPANNNGKRATYMFWIYLTDINLYSGDELRHIFHVGDKTTKGASPCVYLDGMKNRIFVRFSKDSDKVSPLYTISDATTSKVYTSTGLTDLADQINRIKNYPNISTAAADTNTLDEEYNTILGNKVDKTDAKKLGTLDAARVDLATHGVIIDYVPLQRWVHVAIVVNETINKGVITTYIDGEVVDSISSKDKVMLSTGISVDVNFTGLNLTKTGDVYTGGDVNDDDLSQGFPGIIGKINVSNFDMNGKEVYNMYIKGPVDNLTSKIGLPAYAVRSPIYKIG